MLSIYFSVDSAKACSNLKGNQVEGKPNCPSKEKELAVLVKFFQALDLSFDEWTETSTGTLEVILKSLKKEKKRLETLIKKGDGDIG